MSTVKNEHDHIIGPHLKNIKICKACHGSGKLLRVKERELDCIVCNKEQGPPRYIINDAEQVVCWICNGAKRWREDPLAWTIFEMLPHEIGRELESLDGWYLTDKDNGELTFIARFSLDVLSQDNFLQLLKAVSWTGRMLESHGWLIKY